MIRSIHTIRSNINYPYLNQALEKFLFDSVADEDIILFLWQNDHALSLGYNQNLYAEADPEKLEESACFPIRRLSGGGKLIHNAGDLGFSFLTKKDNFDVNKQLTAISKALEAFGLSEKAITGCNYYKYFSRRMMHGVIELADTAISVDALCDQIFQSFEETYALQAIHMGAEDLDFGVITSYEKIFADDGFLFNRNEDLPLKLKKTFSWGSFDLSLEVTDGEITKAQLFSDCQNADAIKKIGEQLEGMPYTCTALSQLITEILVKEEENQMANDLSSFLSTCFS